MIIIDLAWFIVFLIASMQLHLVFVGKKDYRYISWWKKLVGFHFLMGIVFYFFTRNGGGDAWGYWVIGKSMSPVEFIKNLQEGEGTRFMEAFNYIPAHILQMSFFANTMFFSFLGAVGLGCFFSIALKVIKYNKVIYGYPVFPWIFFLPNLHFWSSGVGKDTVLFMCVGLFSYALLQPVRRVPALLVALFLSYAIRPHITLFMLLAFGLSYVFGGKISPTRRFIFSMLFIAVGIVILPEVMKFIKVDSMNVDAFSKRAEGQAAALSVGSGSSVDVSAYPFPVKVFTFLYRPLFFDARSIGMLMSSFDNLIFLLLSIKAFRYRPLATLRNAPFLCKGFLLFAIIGTLAFSSSLGNMGIMVRMKNMFTPGILIYLMWCYSYRTGIEKAERSRYKREINTASLE